MIREELQGTLSYLDFICICSLFTVTNDKSFYIMMIKMEIKKNFLDMLLKEVIDNSHDPNKVIFNFSLYESSKGEKSLL